jgi:hypothetical protein
MGQVKKPEAHGGKHLTTTDLLAEINLALQYDYTIRDIQKLLQKAQAFIDKQRHTK